MHGDLAPASVPTGTARAATNGIAATAVTDVETAASELAAWSTRVLIPYPQGKSNHPTRRLDYTKKRHRQASTASNVGAGRT